MTNQNYFGGIPTKIDVDKLMELFKNYTEGDVIAYTDIVAIIGHGRNSHRYGSVVAQWRKRLMREENALLISSMNVGYRIATAPERIEYSAGQVFSGKRRIMRGSAVAGSTDSAKLDAEGKKLREHILTLPARLRLAELTAPRAIAG